MEWIKVCDGMPSIDHIEKRTQFLVKGFFQIGELKGNDIYDVTRLCNYLPTEIIIFEGKKNFTILEWTYITQPK